MTPFRATADLGGRADFYSTVLRVLGKAVGIALEAFTDDIFPTPRQIGFDPAAPGTSVYRVNYRERASGDIGQTLFTMAGEHGLYGGTPASLNDPFRDDRTFPNDLMTAFPPVNTRDLISDLDVGILSANYINDVFEFDPSMTLAYPSDQGKTLLTRYQADLGRLYVSADPTVAHNDIRVDVSPSGMNLLVKVNGRQWNYPVTSGRSLSIQGGPGGTVHLPGFPLRAGVDVFGGADTALVFDRDPSTAARYEVNSGTVVFRKSPFGATAAAAPGVGVSANRAFPRVGIGVGQNSPAVHYYGVGRLEIDADGGDRVSVFSLSNGTRLTLLDPGAVTVGETGRVNRVLGSVSVAGTGLGPTALTIDASAEPGVLAGVLDDRGLKTLVPGGVSFAAADLNSLVVQGGRGGTYLAINGTPQNLRGDLLARFEGGRDTDLVQVQGTSAILTVDGEGGSDVVSVNAPGLKKPLIVRNTGGFNDLVVNDAGATAGKSVDLGVTTRTDPVRVNGRVVAFVIRKVGVITGLAPGRIEYDVAGTRRLTVGASGRPADAVFPSGTTFNVSDTLVSTRPGAGTTVNLGSAADRVNVAAAGGPLTVNGVGGNDYNVVLGVNDRRLDRIAGAVTVIKAGVRILDQNAPAAKIVQFLPDAVIAADAKGGQPVISLRSSGLTRLLYQGSDRGNAYRVIGRAAGEVSIAGGAGNDTFTVAGGTGLDGLGSVTFSGGGGTDTLSVNDSAGARVPSTDVFWGTVLGQPSVAVQRSDGPSVAAFGLASVALSTSSRGSTVRIHPTPSTTRLTINGGPGDDGFYLDNVVPNAPLTLDGGGGSNYLDYLAYGGSGSQAAPDGAVAWYKGEGDARDAAHGHDGTVVNGVTFGPAEVGKGFAFDGTGYVRVPDAPELEPQNVTVEGWVKSDTGPRLRLLLAKGFAANGISSYQLEADEGGP